MHTSNISTGAKIRNLGALERLFWLLDQNRPAHFAMAAQIEGHVPTEPLREATRALVTRSPLILSAISRSATGELAFVTSSTSEIPLIEIKGDLSAWPNYLADELAVPFVSEGGPLLRMTHLQDEAASIIIIAAHHAIADGTSLASFIGDLVGALKGEQLSTSLMPLSLEEVTQARVSSQGFEQCFPRSPTVELRARTPLPYRATTSSRPHVEAVALESRDTSRIISRAKSEGATVHGALCAAFSAEIEHFHDGALKRPLRVFSPVDARKRVLENDTSLATYISGQTVEYDRKESFWDNARTFSMLYEPIKRTENVIASIRTVESAMAGISGVEELASVWASLFSADLLLSNLGALAVPQSYGDLALAAVWGPAVSLGVEGEQTIGVNTLGGRMHFLHTSFKPILGLLERATDRLKTFG